MKHIENNFIEAFAAQYWGQEVVKFKSWDSKKSIEFYSVLKKDYPQTVIEYIELRSLDSLTDEEAIKMGYGDKDHFNVENLHFNIKVTIDSLTSSDVDYLRSIGIAVSFRGVSVEEMIDSGKLKLKQ